MPFCPLCARALPSSAIDADTEPAGSLDERAVQNRPARLAPSTRAASGAAVASIGTLTAVAVALEAAWILRGGAELALVDVSARLLRVLPVTGTVALAVAGSLAIRGAFRRDAGHQIRIAAWAITLIAACTMLLAPVSAARFERALADRRAAFHGWLAELPNDVGYERLAPLAPSPVPLGVDDLPPTVTQRGGARLGRTSGGETRRGIVVSRARGVPRVDRLDLAIDDSLRARTPAEIEWIVFVHRNTIASAYRYGSDGVAVEHVALVLYRVDHWDALVTAYQQALPPSSTTVWRQRYQLGERMLTTLVRKMVDEAHTARR